jgi:tripartite-type tricarboxylate transporter receptor subunit TctC
MKHLFYLMRHVFSVRNWLIGLLTAWVACWSLAAHAGSAWPARQIKLIVPFTAGGATDAIGRIIAKDLSELWGQTVVVENRTGAGGIVGAEALVKSQPDGYTLLLVSGSMFTVNPHIYSSVPYSLKDFSLISNVATGPMAISVSPDLPVDSLEELIAYAKKNPKTVNFGSAGVGSQTHMAGEALADHARIDITHVPYKGESAANADLMAGHVQLVVGNIAAAVPLINGKRVKGLAVTGQERSPMLPDLPTAAESGLPGFSVQGWFALVAPAGTPPDVVRKIQSDLHAVLKKPEIQTTFQDLGVQPSPTTAEALAQAITEESAQSKQLVERRRIRAN